MPVLSDAPFYAPLASNLTLQHGSGSFSIARTSSASIVDSVTGMLSILSAGNARFDSAKGLLLRSSAVTNTLLYSRDFIAGNTVWSPSKNSTEFVSNGVPDGTTTGWTASDATLSIVSGKLQIQTIVDYGTASTPLTGLVVGKTYVVEADFTKSGGASYISITATPTGGTVLTGQVMNSAGHVRLMFNADSTTKYLRLQVNTLVAGDTVQFSNISCNSSQVDVVTNQIGIDGTANACTLLTANASGATISQGITAAASAGCSGYYVKRSVGAGNVYFTRDNFATLLDITAQLGAGIFSLAKIENTSVLNPTIGFKFDVSGDAIIVDAGINHLGTEIAQPSFTTNAAVTVNAETLTIQTSGNFSDTAGTIIATVERGNWANNNGVVVGKAGSGLSTSASNSGVQALDGTNIVNGPAGATATRRKIGMKWSGSTMKTFAGGNFGTAGSYDGSFNLTTIAIMPQSNGYIRDVAIWPTELSDADMLAVASEQSDFSAALSFAYSAYANVIHSVSAAMPLSFDVTGYTSVIHSVSSDMDIDFNAAIQANVIHSVSADMGIIFDVDFDSTWIIPSLKIDGSYDPPVIQGTYGPTT